MSHNEVPVPGPSSASKPESRKMKGISSLVPVSMENAELKDKTRMLDCLRFHSTSLQSHFIPEEIFRTLTSAASTVYNPEYLQPPKKGKSAKEFKGFLCTPDGLWHHPNRRNKFKHLTDNPICLTGAGRDVSFLYDIALGKEDERERSLAGFFSERGDKQTQNNASPITPAPNIADSLVPEEFHIVKNRGVIPLEYFDDKYTTLLEDCENRLRLFPSMKPSGRLEVIQLMKVMDSMLEKAGVNDETIGVLEPSQLHNVLKVLKAEQNIYNIVFHELIRQVSVDCAERGELLSKLRQKYVNLLDWIPQQMRNLYEELMAQRVMDKHITEELHNFKESIGRLTSELRDVREHDLRVTREAEWAQEELAAAVRDSELNANLVEEYRQLYELQRVRLEGQLKLLIEEREVWSSATYDLALKVIDRNQLTLARKLYLSEKAWTKVVKHFVLLLASEDVADLSNLQEETLEFRELLGHIDEKVRHVEDSTREKLRLVQKGLFKWLQYFQENAFGKAGFSQMKEDVMEGALQDLKNFGNMLNEDLEQFGGDALLASKETFKTAVRLQKHWTELGQAMLSRHKDVNGLMPPEFTVMEEINRSATKLCQQYNIRINGENGVTRILMGLVSSLEDWLFKQLTCKRASDIRESDWLKLYQVIPEWLSQVDALMTIIGSSQSHEEEKNKKPHVPVAPADVFKMIQQWILSVTNETEKNNVYLTQEVVELHKALIMWMVNLLRLMVPDRLSSECPLSEDAEAAEKQLKVFSTCKLEEEAVNLVAKFSRFSSYIISCCKGTVDAIVQKKQSELNLEADYERLQLEKITTECFDWVNACGLLLSEVKGSPVSLLSLEEQTNLFGPQKVQPQTHQVNCVDSSLPYGKSESSHEPRKDKTEHADTDMKPVIGKEMLEAQPLQPAPDASSDGPAVSGEMIEDTIRYIGYDSNIHLKSLKSEAVSVTGREMTASKSTTACSQKEFETLAFLEHLQSQLLKTETRAQTAEEKSEKLEQQLEEALGRIQELEKELEKSHRTQEAASKQIHFQEETSPTSHTQSCTARSRKTSKHKK
ncbi:axonemal dynein light chain domain-containing protein 1 isoform X2 [Alligator mississippiensis]|uniref:axonemal dynein light chain domain-containing protein 1 isoform X2 n=1 Tax=Alligator mississippiensis TaxID=8496 RepID=UPI00287727CC|nr:axonemal dynein light chain domain-containing protein 1 isoform X2 [Alligator mississippiensis]